MSEQTNSKKPSGRVIRGGRAGEGGKFVVLAKIPHRQAVRCAEFIMRTSCAVLWLHPIFRFIVIISECKCECVSIDVSVCMWWKKV